MTPQETKIIQEAKEVLNQGRVEIERRKTVELLGQILGCLKNLKLKAPIVNVPQAKVEVKIPEIKVPEPKVTVNVAPPVIPEIKIPPIKVPEAKVTVKVDAPKIPPIKIPKIEVPEAKVKVEIPPMKIPEIEIPKPKVTIVNSGGGGRGVVEIKGGTGANIHNLTMAAANTEYSYDLPNGTKKLDVKLRAMNAILKIAFTLGHSGTQYVTIPYGSSYHLENVNLRGITLYVQSTSAAQTCEIVAWT